MCIAILTTPGKRLTDNELYRGWSGNRDGAGFAYVDDGEVQIKKGYLEYKPFRDAYNTAVERFGNDSPFLVHMRIRTSGHINANNCHPFKVQGGAMIHNGMLFTPTGARAGTQSDKKSDTRVFAEALHNILILEHVKKAEAGIRKAIGGSNKLAFLYNDSSYHIVGENLGFWRDGVWHSNSACVVPLRAE
jgi:glutamine amidotransferase